MYKKKKTLGHKRTVTSTYRYIPDQTVISGMSMVHVYGEYFSVLTTDFFMPDFHHTHAHTKVMSST